MTKKMLWISTGLYGFCALVWTMNFALHWHMDGRINASTALFGFSAACFGIAAALNVIRLVRLGRSKKEDK